MNNAIRLSSLAYRGILALYPEDLRREFGDEMLDVFVQDLVDTGHGCGPRGVLRVWRRALIEVISIAIPRQLVSPVVIAPAISFGWSAFGARVMGLAGSGLPFWPSLAGAIITYFAVRRCRPHLHEQLTLTRSREP
jgi:hypothetical protein